MVEITNTMVEQTSVNGWFIGNAHVLHFNCNPCFFLQFQLLENAWSLRSWFILSFRSHVWVLLWYFHLLTLGIWLVLLISTHFLILIIWLTSLGWAISAIASYPIVPTTNHLLRAWFILLLRILVFHIRTKSRFLHLGVLLVLLLGPLILLAYLGLHL